MAILSSREISQIDFRKLSACLAFQAVTLNYGVYFKIAVPITYPLHLII